MANSSLIDGLSEFTSLSHAIAIPYVFSCEQNMRMLYISPAIATLGFACERWVDNEDFRLQQLHRDDASQFEQAIENSLNTGEKFVCHYRLHDSNGFMHWFHDEAVVVYDETGSPLFLKGIMVEISEGKAMEAELGEHRYYLDRKVTQRTEQLMKQIEMLKSCNATLCTKLEQSQLALAALEKNTKIIQPKPALILTDQSTEIQKVIKPLDDVGDWQRHNIVWRVKAAGVIT